MIFKKYLPQTLMSRSLLILVVPVVLAQIISVTVFWDNHWDKMTQRLAYALSAEIAVTADQLETNYSEAQYAKLSEYLATYMGLQIYLDLGTHNFPEEAHRTYTRVERFVLTPLLKELDKKLSQNYRVVFDNSGNRIMVYVALESGMLTIRVPEKRFFSSSGYIFVLLLMGSTFSLLLISIVFLRNQIRPIRKLAVAAARMGKGHNVSLGKISGAKEVRQAAIAFETMQKRIRRQIEQRTIMLAGVSHDLRTPLTRVKLGLSMLDNQKEATEMLADLDEMEKMVDAYLEFARGEKIEEATSVHVYEFLANIASLYQDQNCQLVLNFDEEPDHIYLQRVNFRRAIENILSNAARYATVIHMNGQMGEEYFTLDIEDNGPGIPAAQYDEVLKPFVRLDLSRSKETGGAGLGLSVAMDIILAHGGNIILGKSSALGGLRVRMTLPV